MRSTDLTSSEKEALAVDIALAAIVGDGVFNFGEVLAQEIVQTLKSTSKAWLLDVLFCLHRGDIEGFSKIVSAHRSEFDAQVSAVRCNAHDDAEPTMPFLLFSRPWSRMKKPFARSLLYWH